MIRIILMLLGVIVAVAANPAAVQAAPNPVVRVESGRIEGSGAKYPDIIAFRGIPYAAPPMRHHRSATCVGRRRNPPFHGMACGRRRVSVRSACSRPKKIPPASSR